MHQLHSSNNSNYRVVSLSMTINPSSDAKVLKNSHASNDTASSLSSSSNAVIVSNGHATYRVKDRTHQLYMNGGAHMASSVNVDDELQLQQANCEHSKLSKEERVRLVREKREQELLKRKKEIEENLKRKQELRDKQILERKKRVDEQKFKENEKRTAAVERRKKREEMARVNQN